MGKVLDVVRQEQMADRWQDRVDEVEHRVLVRVPAHGAREDATGWGLRTSGEGELRSVAGERLEAAHLLPLDIQQSPAPGDPLDTAKVLPRSCAQRCVRRESRGWRRCPAPWLTRQENPR